jgi:hypothetical protein
MISPADQRSLLGIYEIEFDCVNTNGQESDWTRQPYGSVGLSYADSFQARLTSRATFLLHATARYVPVRPQSTYPKGLATPLATSICEHPLPFLCACIETSFRVNDTLTAPFAVASPYKSHNMSSAEPFTLLSIGLITIIVRIYFRWRSVGPANWQIDDYLMPLTGVSYPACDSVHLIHTLVIRTFTNADASDSCCSPQRSWPRT